MIFSMETHSQNKQEEDIQLNLESSTKPVNNPISPSSSPSHDFSFTVSLHSHTKNAPHPSFAIDLSPADEIFFHGHLLPLHLLSNLPLSPRISIDSLDSFTLPIKDFSANCNSIIDQDDFIHLDHFQDPIFQESCSGAAINSLQEKETNIAEKPKSFSLFKWRKEKGHGENELQKQRRGPKLVFSNAVKRYVRLINPFVSFKNMNLPHERQTNSLSGNLRIKNKKELRGRRGEFSAPASMRTSPTNSGLLAATSGTLTPTSANDSTMEELQAAIQSAIAHCKKSISAKENQ